MKNYLDHIYNETPHNELLQLADDTKKNVYKDIKNFSMDGDTIQSAISDISNYWMKTGGGVENKIRSFFSILTKPDTTTDDDYLQKKLFALQILYGLITKSRSSSAGMLFEHYIAGIIGAKQELPTDEQSPADIMVGNTWLNIKLYAGSIKVKKSTVQKIYGKDNIFVIGFKGAKNLEIYVFNGKTLIEDAYNNDTGISISLNIAKAQTKRPVIIDFENVINTLITARVSPSLDLIRKTSDFLTEVGTVFSKKNKTYDKAKGIHKDIGKTLKEVI